MVVENHCPKTFLQKSEFFFFPFENEALLSEMQCSIGTVMILMTAFSFIIDLKINQVLHIDLNIKKCLKNKFYS